MRRLVGLAVLLCAHGARAQFSWLLANELQLRQDLALGTGPALDDLAALGGIAPAHRAHFGRLLQRNRQKFLTRRDLTPREAARIMACVGELIFADPLLRPDGEAVVAAW